MYKNIGHTFCKTFSTSVLFLNIALCLHAAQISNYAEMGSALATVPLSTAANFCDSNNNEKRAVQLRMLSNLFSVINKSLFLYNSMYTKWAHNNNDDYEWMKDKDVYIHNTNTSDYLINTAIALHDLAQIYINFKAYNQAKHQKMQNPKLQKSKLNDEYNDELDDELYNDDLDDLNSDYNSNNHENEEGFDTVNKDKEITLDNERDDSVDDFTEIEALVKNRQIQEANKPSAVFIRALISTLKKTLLPALKGSTAFALACMQPNVSDNSGKQIRSVLTNASLLTTLIDDYSLLKPDTGYAVKAPLIVLIAGCTVLLCYQLKMFNDGERKLDSSWGPETPPLPTFEVVAKGKLGHCDNCFCDGLKLIKLPCGQHSRCAGCIGDAARYIYKEGYFEWDDKILTDYKCEQKGCVNRPVTQDDLTRLFGQKGFKQHQAYAKWKTWQYERDEKARQEAKEKARQEAKEKARQDALDEAASKDLIEHTTIPCPNTQCKYKFAGKDNHCQHAKCKCETEICFCCGKRINSYHYHYDNPGGADCGFSYAFNSNLHCPNECTYHNVNSDESGTISFIEPGFWHTREENGVIRSYAKVWCRVCKQTFFARSTYGHKNLPPVTLLREMPKPNNA